MLLYRSHCIILLFVIRHIKLNCMRMSVLLCCLFTEYNIEYRRPYTEGAWTFSRCQFQYRQEVRRVTEARPRRQPLLLRKLACSAPGGSVASARRSRLPATLPRWIVLSLHEYFKTTRSFISLQKNKRFLWRNYAGHEIQRVETSFWFVENSIRIIFLFNHKCALFQGFLRVSTIRWT